MQSGRSGGACRWPVSPGGLPGLQLLVPGVHAARFWSVTLKAIQCACLGAKLFQSCPVFCNPIDCHRPGSSIHGILPARILEWVAISFSRGSSQPRDRTQEWLGLLVKRRSLIRLGWGSASLEKLSRGWGRWVFRPGTVARAVALEARSPRP